MTLDNKDELIDQVKSVLSYSQGIHKENLNFVDVQISTWQQNKNHLSNKWLEGNLIANFGPVHVDFTSDEKLEKLNQFLDDICEADYLLDILNTDELHNLIEFMHAQGENFFDNKVSVPWEVNGHIIQEGSKIIKSLKYFIEDDDDILRILQDYASSVIQEGKVTGNLYISVHPLDYLSASENNYNWRSCHALDGDFRAGNMSYILDQVTMVCYIANPYEKHKLPRFPAEVPWNDKKWRMLLFISPDGRLAFAGRQYPFFSKSLLDIIKTRVLTSTFSPWSNNQFDNVNILIDDSEENYWLYSNSIGIFHNIVPLESVVMDNLHTYHFDDLLESSCYKPYYCYDRDTFTFITSSKKYRHNEPPLITEDTKIVLGGFTTCSCCGKDEVYGHNDFTCGWCKAKYTNRQDGICTCDNCGKRMPMTAVHNVINSVTYSLVKNNNITSIRYCDECLEKIKDKVIYCDFCEFYHYKEQKQCPYCSIVGCGVNFENMQKAIIDADTLPQIILDTNQYDLTEPLLGLDLAF